MGNCLERIESATLAGLAEEIGVCAVLLRPTWAVSSQLRDCVFQEVKFCASDLGK
jgi:hypothetical protein